MSNETLYSPYTNEVGEYPIEDFKQSEFDDIEDKAGETLYTDEWIAPLIPETIIHKAVAWYAEVFVDGIVDGKEVSSDEFRGMAKDYVVTYNLKGGEWFKNLFEEYYKEELEKRWDDLEDQDLMGLTIVPIHVTSAVGLKEFDEPRVVEWYDDFEGKHVISLDDIGDRGVTQEAIRKKADADGAESVTTVNLIEKIVPDDVKEKKQKLHSPDIALLQIAYRYVLGCGLDDGVRDSTREFKSIVALLDGEPDEGELSYQGEL